MMGMNRIIKKVLVLKGCGTIPMLQLVLQAAKKILCGYLATSVIKLTTFLAGLLAFSAAFAASTRPTTTIVSATGRTREIAIPEHLPMCDIQHNAKKLEEFARFDRHYADEMSKRLTLVQNAGEQVYLFEKFGRNTERSHQILAECIWLLSSTADYKRVDRRLADLKDSLAHPEREAEADKQDPTDGSWGRGYNEWFFKLVASFRHLKEVEDIPPKFLDRINSPELLTKYLDSVAVSDIPRTGIDNYREFNESLSCIQRLILRKRPRGYAWHPQITQTLMDLLLNRFRNKETGFWGESYARDGKVVFIDDLSMTFHTISYLDGKVSDLPKVIDTTLAVKDLDFPVGWRMEGSYWNHNNMDVVELFRLGWPHASDMQKASMIKEIDDMLQWCLSESLQEDGSFKTIVADGSIEEGVYYGTSFLGRIGFFDRSRRFWTNRDFPQAAEIRKRILNFVEKHKRSGATGGDYYEGTLEELNIKK